MIARLCQRAMTVAFVYLALLATALYGQTHQFWPEVDTFLHLNDQSRLMFSVQSTREESVSTEMDIGAHVDVFVKPLRKARLLTSHSPDVAKSRVVLFRVGYHYLLPYGSQGASENRIIVEATPRYPVPFGIILADRSRVDLRFTQGDFSWRYRNRITAERTFRVHGYSFDPYVRGEVWFDSLYQKWSRTLIQIGSDFPITRRASLEPYYEHQNNTSTSPNEQRNALGVVLNLRF